MQRLIFAALCVVGFSAAHAQVTCNTLGNQTTCNGSLGPAIAPMPFVNFGQSMAAQQQGYAQAQAAQAQAALFQERAALIREQRAAIARQPEAARGRQGQEDLQAQTDIAAAELAADQRTSGPADQRTSGPAEEA